MSVSTFLHLRLSHLLSLSFAAPISVSDHFLETLPWGSRSPVCRKPDLHHLFFIFWKRPLNFLPEGSGGGGSGLPGSTSFHPPSFTESILAPPHPSSLSPELRAEAFSAQGHYGTRNQAPIHHLPSTAYCRVGKAESPLVYRWFANLGKSEDSRHRESPGG